MTTAGHGPVPSGVATVMAQVPSAMVMVSLVIGMACISPVASLALQVLLPQSRT
jgi:multisubunit Na+/H+ antiporter MnhC subunit